MHVTIQKNQTVIPDPAKDASEGDDDPFDPGSCPSPVPTQSFLMHTGQIVRFPNHRAGIFNPFVTTRESGTGLGLAITQRIIHGHEGYIELESQPGQGTCFTICLPFQKIPEH